MQENQKTVRALLQQVKEGTLSVEQAEAMMQSYEDYGFFKLDIHREKRKGFPEVIYGEGKTAEQITAIMKTMIQRKQRVLVTRVSEEKASTVLNTLKDVTYDSMGRTLTWLDPDEVKILYPGHINVVSAGTSDLPVAMEASVAAEMMGCQTEVITDVGVAGIHRLFDKLPKILEGTVTIVAAGMEGALPSVVGGLVSHPLIAVPTSVGYGANFGGVSALLSMLNACSSGISVVNIDNGFGAGYNAAMIHRLIYEKQADSVEQNL